MAQGGGQATPLDWGAGRYETTAARLAPVAQVVVERASPRPGERVLDLGCGTGNAALLAARAGATATGVDPAPRLLQVARERARAAGLDVDFRTGEAASIPLADGSVDVIVSVFAVIFAPDPVAAASEMSRALSADGRIVLSAWLPGGAVLDMTRAAGEAVMRAVGAPAPVEGFRWQDRNALAGLFGGHGFTVDVEEHELVTTAQSVDEYLEEQSNDHPMAVTGMSVLERLGQADEVKQRLRRILIDGNEEPGAFRATSRYVVATLSRRPAG